MSANGYISQGALGPIPGSNSGLRADAAQAYRAMAVRAGKLGTSMAISDGSVGRCYRSYARQVLAKRQFGSNAATPGTSNHGLGLAVDLQTLAQRQMVDRIGRSYGFCKAWSDASWEWWHIKWREGVYRLAQTPSSYPTLRAGQGGPLVRRAQQLLHGKNVRGAPKPTGYFGAATKSAVKRFQAKHHIQADGIIGAKTWNKLRS